MNEDIYVVCGDPVHDGKVAKIQPFRRDGERGWAAVLARYPKGAGSDLRPLLRNAQHLEGDTPRSWQTEEPAPGAWRRRYRLECPLCGRCVPARHEKLVLVLDGLEAAGVASIDLRYLPGTLKAVAPSEP